MNLILTRKTITAHSTIGELRTEDGKLICFTLEDVTRPDGQKIPGETAIPEGVYEIVIDESKRFKCRLPRLLDVPNFEGIRIHPGNCAEDTHGCILVGMTKEEDRILNSRVAMDTVFNVILEGLMREKVFIVVTDAWRGRDILPKETEVSHG